MAIWQRSLRIHFSRGGWGGRAALTTAGPALRGATSGPHGRTASHPGKHYCLLLPRGPMRSVCVLQNEAQPGGAQAALLEAPWETVCFLSLCVSVHWGGTRSCVPNKVEQVMRGCRCRPTISILWASDTNGQWCPSRPTVPGCPYREIPWRRAWPPSQYPRVESPTDGGLSPWDRTVGPAEAAQPACPPVPSERGLAAS